MHKYITDNVELSSEEEILNKKKILTKKNNEEKMCFLRKKFYKFIFGIYFLRDLYQFILKKTR